MINLNIFRRKQVGARIIALIAILLFSIQLSFSQDYKTVKAQKGDGIFSLLKRHGLPASDFKKFVEINKSALGKDKALIVGRSYKLPVTVSPAETNNSSSGGTVYKIFGPKHQLVKPVDSQLKGAVYYLMSGHGGPDPGAVGKHNGHLLCEDEYAYDVTLRLARKLIEHGALVYMITRDNNDGIRDESILKPDKDEVCYPNLRIPAKHMTRLRQRKNAVNKLYSKYKGRFQRQVVIHVDSRSKGENIDVFFYHDKRSKTGKKMAQNLLQTFDSKYREHQPGRGYHGTISTRNLYVIKYSYPPAVYIELGNINHHRDKLRFIKENNRQALANWMAEAMLKDFKNNK